MRFEKKMADKEGFEPSNIYFQDYLRVNGYGVDVNGQMEVL
jgi:hypothetical protein